MICGSAGSKKVGSLKRRVRSHVRGRHEKLHAAVGRSTFSSQNVQNTPASDHFLKLGCGKIARRCSEKHISKSKCTKHTILGPFLKLGCGKLHATVARSAFASRNVKNMRGSSLFLTLGCGKIPRRCGEKHICKSKCTKHMHFGPFLEVPMSRGVRQNR